MCQSIVNQANTELGGLTTLVNCAGVLQGGAFGSAACTLENFLFNMNGNTKSVFELMTAAVPYLKAAGTSGRWWSRAGGGWSFYFLRKLSR